MARSANRLIFRLSKTDQTVFGCSTLFSNINTLATKTAWAPIVTSIIHGVPALIRSSGRARARRTPQFGSTARANWKSEVHHDRQRCSVTQKSDIRKNAYSGANESGCCQPLEKLKTGKILVWRGGAVMAGSYGSKHVKWLASADSVSIDAEGYRVHRADEALMAPIILCTVDKATLSLLSDSFLASQFDSLVIDEASQIMAHNALGIVQRMNLKRLVIVGDHNQLPPVAFHPRLRRNLFSGSLFDWWLSNAPSTRPKLLMLTCLRRSPRPLALAISSWKYGRRPNSK